MSVEVPTITAKGKAKRDTSRRRQQITEMIRTQGSVQVFALADTFGVSMQTIRKDLHFLEEHGIASCAYGGAISASIVNVKEPPIEAKRSSHMGEKERIGRLAASLINPGDTVMLDSGTTTVQIAQFIEDDDSIAVVTNDFGVMTILVQKTNVRIFMLGGEFRRKNTAFYGAKTIEALNDLQVDKLFLGVDGFDIKGGITTHYEPEAMLNRRMVEAARQVIAVTDSSKFGKVCLHRIIDIDGIDDLVTDSNAPEYIHETAENLPFRIHLA